jgi:hypothetical protein
MNKFLLAGVAAVGLAIGAASANAAPLLQLNGGTPFMTPPNGGDGITGNQIIPNTPGYVGGQLVALSSVTLTFTFLGFEASWLDNFYVGGVQVFQNKTSTVGATYEVTVGPGAIDFGFLTNVNLQDGFPQRFVSNLNPPPNVDEDVDIWTGRCDKSGATTASEGESFCFSPDDGGAGPNDNHDDLVVSVSAVPAVPEPGTLAVFGAALAGLGLLRRRRSA